MTIERLMQVVPPPVEPFEPFTEPWEPVETHLGFALPPDYKDFARLYGRGNFGNFLTINLPGDRHRRGSLEGELHMAREMINFGAPVRYPAWPDSGGLLNIGFTALNDRIFWLPRGEPSNWRIVVWDRAFQNFETFDCDLTDFIAGLASGAVRPEGFPDDTPIGAPSFEPLVDGAGHPSPPTSRGGKEAPSARKGIEALTQVVPPPAKPFRPFDGPWAPLEAYLGTELPQDYKDFSRLYGGGLFMDFLFVHVPEVHDSRLTLEPQVRDAPSMFMPGEKLPYEFWPHVDGLIRFGGTDYGDQLYWLPEGAPDDWKVVMWQRHGRFDQPFEAFNCGLAEFLGGLADGTIVPGAYKEGLEPYEPMFLPHSDSAGRTDAREEPHDHPTTIKRLTQVIPPPAKPFEAFTGPWGPVEAELGTRLPQDYKDFVRTYGSGLLLGVMTIRVPRITNPHVNLESRLREAARHSGLDEQRPYGLWPQIGGLIEFGGTDNGDRLYWLPRGPPDTWKVVFWDRGLSEDEAFEEFDCGMAEFLAGLADGSILPKGHEREDLEPIGPIFQPYSDRVED